jgi:CDP-glucose 4,6-dehydratase
LPEPYAFNFGPAQEDAVPVRAVADGVAARWGNGAAWVQDNRYQPYEARLLEVDSARAKSTLRWRPRWRLDQALDRTIAWYKAHSTGDDMQAITLKQIDEYLHG